MIDCRNVTVSSAGHAVLSDLTVRFESNQSYLITGANGSGKTTLLKLLAGKIHPQFGSIVFDFIPGDIDWEDKFELRRKLIHLVPAQALHELLRSPDLFYQQRYYSMEHAPLPTVQSYLGARVENLPTLPLSESFGLEPLLDRKLTELSNGQLKKVMILRQLLDTIPKVLLLDYPFEGLDAASRAELADFLDALVTSHGIQLLVADKEHDQLPRSLSRTVTLKNKKASVGERLVKTELMVSSASEPVRTEERSGKPPVVEMKNVRIQYGERVVIDNLNWKVYQGDRWAVTGPNGSGKTTLFSLIYADHPMAYSEHVSLFGKRRGTGESIWDIKRRISYLGPEQIHFADPITEQLTVRQFISSTHPIDHTSIVAYFKIEHLLERRLHVLSQGEWQLVFLLSLFLSQKELLLLDEPFQFLDRAQHERVTDYPQVHLAASSTLLLITHYEEDVARWTQQRLSLG